MPTAPTRFPQSEQEWRDFAATPAVAGIAGVPSEFLQGPRQAVLARVDADARHVLLRYLAGIGWAKEHAKGVLLCGAQGGGKSCALALIAEAWGRHFGVRRPLHPGDAWSAEVRTMMYESGPAFARTFNLLPPDGERAEREDYLRRLAEVDLLLFDDLGSGELSKLGVTNLVTLLESRITTHRVTCLSMNGELDALRAIPGLARLPDKLRDCLVRPIPFPDQSRRDFTAWEEIGG